MYYAQYYTTVPRSIVRMPFINSVKDTSPRYASAEVVQRPVLDDGMNGLEVDSQIDEKNLIQYCD